MSRRSTEAIARGDGAVERRRTDERAIPRVAQSARRSRGEQRREDEAERLREREREERASAPAATAPCADHEGAMLDAAKSETAIDINPPNRGKLAAMTAVTSVRISSPPRRTASFHASSRRPGLKMPRAKIEPASRMQRPRRPIELDQRSTAGVRAERLRLLLGEPQESLARDRVSRHADDLATRMRFEHRPGGRRGRVARTSVATSSRRSVGCGSVRMTLMMMRATSEGKPGHATASVKRRVRKLDDSPSGSSMAARPMGTALGTRTGGVIDEGMLAALGAFGLPARSPWSARSGAVDDGGAPGGGSPRRLAQRVWHRARNFAQALA